jgi:hypothetical protein
LTPEKIAWLAVRVPTLKVNGLDPHGRLTQAKCYGDAAVRIYEFFVAAIEKNGFILVDFEQPRNQSNLGKGCWDLKIEDNNSWASRNEGLYSTLNFVTNGKHDKDKELKLTTKTIPKLKEYNPLMTLNGEPVKHPKMWGNPDDVDEEEEESGSDEEVFELSLIPESCTSISGEKRKAAH